MSHSQSTTSTASSLACEPGARSSLREVERYEDSYLLCYVRGPEGPAEQFPGVMTLDAMRTRSRPTAASQVLRCVRMERIGIRELRQNASEWIRRAHAGERIEVTRRGEVMAVLGPPTTGGALAQLRKSGRLKPGSVTGPLPSPVPTRRPASEALAELRADER
jgi:prevent-host-death family protein